MRNLYHLSKSSIEKYEIDNENKIRAHEIMLFSNKLKEFGVSFNDLVSNSPKHKDTREELMNIAFEASKNIDIVEKLLRTKQLPIKQICILTSKRRNLLKNGEDI